MISSEELDKLIDFSVEPFKSMLHPDHPEYTKDILRFMLAKIHNNEMVNGYLAFTEDEFEEFKKNNP